MNETSPAAGQSNVVSLNSDDPGTMVAAVPHLLGVRAFDSLVVITLTKECNIGVTARVDLPAPGSGEQRIASQLAGMMQRNDVVVAWIVVIGTARDDRSAPAGGWTEPGESGRPYRALVDTVSEALTEGGIGIQDAVWVRSVEAGETWWSYAEDRSGQVPDPSSTELAASMTFAGKPAFRDLDELVATLEPVPTAVLERTAELLRSRELRTDVARPGALGVLADAIDKPTDLSSPDACERVADLVTLLWPHPVRAACLTMALSKRAGRARQLWTALTKATPPPWRAVPAVLLAVTAWVQRDGNIARAAIGIALDADPNHVLARALSFAMARGTSPESLARMVTEAYMPEPPR